MSEGEWVRVLDLEQPIFEDRSRELLSLRAWVQESRRREQNDRIVLDGAVRLLCIESGVFGYH